MSKRLPQFTVAHSTLVRMRAPLQSTLALSLLAAAAAAQTGTPVPALAPYDTFVTNLLTKHSIPGAALAITRNGQLIYARGFGFADAQRTVPVQPDSIFRTASLSKLVTGVAVMKLSEQGRLDLDARAFALIPDLQPPPGSTRDPRLAGITVRHLLYHAGGWDRDKRPGGFDPMFIPQRVATALDIPLPPSTEDIIRYMMSQPLDFTPGERYAYSNFGYAILGRIIERVTGESYEDYVRVNILAPAGISRMRIGQSLRGGESPGEVNYVGGGGAASIFPGVSGPVEWAYGGWYLEAMDAHGGWIASTIDYAKFLNAIDGRRGSRTLSAASVQTLTARPGLAEYRGTAAWYAMGTSVNTSNNWWHSGRLDGSATYSIRTGDGFTYVIFLNATGNRDDLYNDLDRGYWDARARVTTWPTTDLFPDFPDTAASTFAATPSIEAREGVVNGATFLRGTVSGSWFTIFGSNLAPGTRSWTERDIVNGALPQSLDNVGVTVDGRPAYVYFISPGQINAQAPEGLTAGWRRVEVTRNGIASNTVMARTVATAPGALTYSLGGRTFAVATNAAGTVLGDPSLASGIVTCAPGEPIVVYTTGLATSPAGTATPSQSPLSNVTATISGRAAAIAFAGLISPGLFQINLTVPPGLAAGDHELLITAGANRSPRGVVVYVRPR